MKSQIAAGDGEADRQPARQVDAEQLGGDVAAVERADRQEVEQRPPEVLEGEEVDGDVEVQLAAGQEEVDLLLHPGVGVQPGPGRQPEHGHRGERTRDAHDDAAHPAERRPTLADRHAPEAVEDDHRWLAERLQREAVAQLVDEDRHEAARDPDEDELEAEVQVLAGPTAPRSPGRPVRRAPGCGRSRSGAWPTRREPTGRRGGRRWPRDRRARRRQGRSGSRAGGGSRRAPPGPAGCSVSSQRTRLPLRSLFQWLTVRPSTSRKRTVTRRAGAPASQSMAAACSFGSRSHTTRSSVSSARTRDRRGRHHVERRPSPSSEADILSRYGGIGSAGATRPHSPDTVRTCTSPRRRAAADSVGQASSW